MIMQDAFSPTLEVAKVFHSLQAPARTAHSPLFTVLSCFSGPRLQSLLHSSKIYLVRSVTAVASFLVPALVLVIFLLL